MGEVRIQPCWFGRNVYLPRKAYRTVSTEKRRYSKRNTKCGIRAIVIAAGLVAALGNFDSQQRGDQRPIEVVHGRVNMSAVDVRIVVIFFGRDGVLVECLVVRVFQADFGESLILFDNATADNLDLWLMRNCCQVGMENAAFVY